MASLLDHLARLQQAYFGNKKLLPIEESCLQAWRETISERGQATLASQLASVDLVQRQPGGAKVCFYWIRRRPPELFPVPTGELEVATVLLQGAGDHTMAVKVFVVDGHLFSFEFPKRPERYLQLHGMAGAPLRASEVRTHLAL